MNPDDGVYCSLRMNGKIVNKNGEGFLGTVVFPRAPTEPVVTYEEFSNVEDSIGYYINRYRSSELQ